MADALAAALQKRKEKVSRSGKFLLHFFLTTFATLLCHQLTPLKNQTMKTMMMTGRSALSEDLGWNDATWRRRGLTWAFLRKVALPLEFWTKVITFVSAAPLRAAATIL